MNTEIEASNKGRLSKDALVFLGMVLLGFAVMFALKALHVRQGMITLLIAGIVVGYSVMVFRMKRLHLRLDQAGDNAYYLGLIFTLMSMGWALWEIGARMNSGVPTRFSVAETVIGDFGLALGSTLAGIICRIMLHQMRIDPADVETQARILMAQAANRMVQKLNDLTSGFGEFFEMLRQKQEDYATDMADAHRLAREQMETRMQAAVDESTAALQSASSEIAESIRAFSRVTSESTDALTTAVERLKGVEPPPTRLNQRFDEMTDKVGRVSEALAGASSGLSGSVEQIRESSRLIAGTVEALAAVGPTLSGDLEKGRQGLADSTEMIKASVGGLNKQIAELSSGIERLADGAARSAEAVAVSESSAVEVLERLAKVVHRIDGALVRSGAN